MTDDEIQEFRRQGLHSEDCCGIHGTYGMCLREVREIEWLN